MKKFLIFLVSIVVVVCIGLTTFYFLKNDEIITFEVKELYVNAGDTISLEELGLTRKKANKKTTFNYNAGGEDVTSAICFDEEKGYYEVKGNVAGDIKLVISTSNEKYAEFTITVHVGNGEKETPYYIFNETDLSKIGSVYGLNDYYVLMNNIALSSEFKPIGYSEIDAKYVGFSGGFDGRFNTISSLNLVDGTFINAGLFSSINVGASVSNLTISNANISGSYTNAGVLAGVVDGNIDRIAVINSTITNKANTSNTGALAGLINSSAKLIYADNSIINIGTDSVVTDAVAGGLFGKINQATIQASYVNNSTINVFAGSTGKFGGFAGKFIIDTEKGSIQQSYANVTSEDTNFAAFLGEIEKSATFTAVENDIIKFLIGNAVVTNGKDIVKNYDATYFTTFKDVSNSSYLIDSFATAGEMQIAADENKIVFYAIDSQQITYWDNEYIWQTSNSALPTLKMGKVNPELPSSEYFRKDLENNEINETNVKFEDVFSTNVTDMKFTLTEDVTLDSWTPVALTNVTLDGGNHTITVNLNNANGENLGLFSVLNNCTIKNLNIVVTNVSANATNVGALAGVATSNSISYTTIENVNVSYNNVENITATNFGGIVAVAEKTGIYNSKVLALSVDANIANIGGVVAELKENASIESISIIATLNGTQNVGGVVATNVGTISNINNSNIAIIYNKNVENAKLGGIVATNNGNILNSNAEISISINNANNSIYAGGVVATNNGVIENSKITGAGIIVADLNANIYIGGVVAENIGTIKSVQNELNSIGSVNTGKNVKVGGISAKNSGTISKVVVKSNVLGNYAAGAVVEMSSSSAKVDQIAITNTIKGDKYVAGIIVDFRAGSITNIQATSVIEGTTNNTRSSLIALIFPYGAKLKNATVSSSIGGYGIFYRETWSDFASYSNKAEFGLPASSTYDGRFNLYQNDTHHGCMQSVVIDSSKAGVNNAKASMGDAFAFNKDYTDSSESSYIKVVNGFNSINQFTGSFEFVCAKSTWFGIEHKATKSLNFDIGSIWKDSGNGISLIFMDSLN